MICLFLKKYRDSCIDYSEANCKILHTLMGYRLKFEEILTAHILHIMECFYDRRKIIIEKLKYICRGTLCVFY